MISQTCENGTRADEMTLKLKVRTNDVKQMWPQNFQNDDANLRAYVGAERLGKERERGRLVPKFPTPGVQHLQLLFL